MMDAISWYLGSVSAFFDSLATSGILKLILIWFIISQICGRRGRWGRGCHRRRWRCRCRHCGCRCGHCPCGDGEDEQDEQDKDADVDYKTGTEM